MKIERSRLMTLGEFAEKFDLTMMVRRLTDRRYVATFKGVRVYRNKVWVALLGEGDTETEAIIDYSKEISCERISLGENLEFGDDRIVYVPSLLPEWSESGKPEREAR